jgi:citrate synthase
LPLELMVSFRMGMSRSLISYHLVFPAATPNSRLIPILKDTISSSGKPINLNPNVDFFSASAYYTMEIPLDLFTPIFAIARVTGWSAHVMEQHKNNRIIRPTDDYTGPFGLTVVPIAQRS